MRKSRRTTTPSTVTTQSPIIPTTDATSADESSEFTPTTTLKPQTSSIYDVTTEPAYVTTSGPDSTSSGGGIVTDGPIIPTTFLPLPVTSGPSVTTKAPPMTTELPPTTTPVPQTSTVYVTTTTAAQTTGAPYVTSGSPIVTSGAPIVTSGAPYVTSGAPIVTSGAPYVTTTRDTRVDAMGRPILPEEDEEKEIYPEAPKETIEPTTQYPAFTTDRSVDKVSDKLDLSGNFTLPVEPSIPFITDLTGSQLGVGSNDKNEGSDADAVIIPGSTQGEADEERENVGDGKKTEAEDTTSKGKQTSVATTTPGKQTSGAVQKPENENEKVISGVLPNPPSKPTGNENNNPSRKQISLLTQKPATQTTPDPVYTHVFFILPGSPITRSTQAPVPASGNSEGGWVVIPAVGDTFMEYVPDNQLKAGQLSSSKDGWVVVPPPAVS